MNTTQQYDYIIAGAGCAGLSLAVHIIQSGKLADKKILLIDKSEKKQNDRTWCFWETQPGLFESIIYRRWNNAWFHSNSFSRKLELAPYEYKLVRGIDFYEYCFDIIRQQPNVDIVFDDILSIETKQHSAVLQTSACQFEATYIFNSILFEKPVVKKNEFYLLQHFKGWVIETKQPVFDITAPVLMDFQVDQQHGTTFVYVMPFSATQALVEYTLFTKDLLQPMQYEEGLKKYIRQVLNIQSYTIIEEEFGIIPMTNYKFPKSDGQIVSIGTAGGQTKPSSGYTFRFIQKHSQAIVHQLIKGDDPLPAGNKKRFHFYDSTLLHILQHDQLPGATIFTDLFQKNKPQQVLRFLDNESSIQDEVKIISSLPTWPFLKAAIRQF
ncbi:MAG TPA: lycopene cyclase family protein [Chitinophagaceae bacterium]